MQVVSEVIRLRARPLGTFLQVVSEVIRLRAQTGNICRGMYILLGTGLIVCFIL